MKTFNISDFVILNNGSNIVMSNIRTLNTNLKRANFKVKELYDSDSFQGPIATDFLKKYLTANKNIFESINELTKFSLFLQESSFNYMESDNTNSNAIGGV